MTRSPPSPDDGTEPARNENELERLDRHWIELLQELRVVQTGVQLLTGLLLTVPFQWRFPQLDDFQRGLYLVAVSLSVCATASLIAPVALHRALFRQHARPALVDSGQRFAVAGLGILALAVVAVVWLIFDLVLGREGALLAAALAFLLFAVLWTVGPWRRRRRARRER
ncbi:sodium:proton antiporter [Pseudonocardia sp. C8]|uniref:DUF6328 family protein n=1 Tax=Pseudonocardia sp. C8 TaxID=2762759 RepID=UPI00164346D3|nr:DUF6328 family protein [Pseudonocardia sp. C8]MBC3191358.1 sodium:proton antiporter [Pseudonocardia sp. C8]